MNQSPTRIPIQLKENPYQIVIGDNILYKIGEELIRAGFKKGIKVLVVTNSDVSIPYSDLFLKSLNENGFKTHLKIIEAGEHQKNQETISLIYEAAYKAKLERGSLMIALGGGVVGDMTGFAAATWLRGISVVQVPTTLLAMVDASIGGKTGINHPCGKNLIGAFHQPKLVLIDPRTLRTLPKREFKAGIAEVIKYGIISDPQIFKILEKELEIGSINTLEKNNKLLREIIERSATVKANVVVSDELEAGIRAILNYGHTFGHVIETLCGYGTYLHGEAISIGMVAIGELACKRGSWSKENSERQKNLLLKAELPVNWPKVEIKKVLETLSGDKKVKDGKLRFIMPKDIGSVEICNDISEEEINYCLSSLI